jgi:putative transposase
MVSKLRNCQPGYIYHVFNRGAQRQELFHCDQSYADFETLIKDTFLEIPLPIFTYELMPNHWHFVVRPTEEYQVSDFFQQLAGTHGKRFRVASETIGEGHVYQDRFKSFPVESDGHFLALCRYVERNAKRAKLVERAEKWRWGAMWRRMNGLEDWLVSDWPVPRPDNWIARVNEPLTANEMLEIRRCIVRGTPFGSPDWISTTAERLGLKHTLRPVGRPRRISQ